MKINISFHEENYFLHEHNSHREACFSISIDFNSCQYCYKALQFVTVSFPSFLRRFFNTLQYVCRFLLSVKTATTSTTEIKHIILRNQ